MKYPVICKTSADKTEFCYRAQELLRLLHNAIGKEYREERITKAQWNIFLDERFEPLSQKVCKGITDNRELLFKSTKYLIDLEKI